MRTFTRVLLGLSLAIVTVLMVGRGDAYIVAFFRDTDTYLKDAKDVVVAKCVAVPKSAVLAVDGLNPAEVDVLLVLKGDRKPGAMKIVGHELQVGQTYLLASNGGHVGDVDFVAMNELAVVHLPADAPLDAVKGVDAKAAVQKLMAFRLNEVEQKLAPLLREQAALQTALAGRTDDLFDSKGNVHIGDILETTTQAKGRARYLELGSRKLEWSSQMAGESGYLYFIGSGLPAWEYATSSNTEFGQFEGKPLKARFVGYRSPGTSGNSIVAKVGQMILARATDEPDVVYIIKFDSQTRADEMATVHYAKVGRAKQK